MEIIEILSHIDSFFIMLEGSPSHVRRYLRSESKIDVAKRITRMGGRGKAEPPGSACPGVDGIGPPGHDAPLSAPRSSRYLSPARLPIQALQLARLDDAVT